jgi:hypothetical protein
MIKFKYAIRGDRKFPIIPITLIKKDFEIDTDGLIDSGANISLLRAVYPVESSTIQLGRISSGIF